MPTTTLEIRTILDDVVHQFSDPLAFFRELVQNAIDAGTGDIDIDLIFEPGLSNVEGRAIITVRDFGEGMTRKIIETKLVRLFSSGKDDDLTKIGRFGIGFVSVFAIEPETVAVDTGREGQHWRVLFGEDRTYELFQLPHPIEGTHIRIFKNMSKSDFQDLLPRAKKTVIEWCKHAEIPIRFNGDEIRQEFRVPSTFTTTYEEQGTRIVMGFSDQSETITGYYNRGLTLKESSRSPWPWVHFKIDSRYLEHTLTRDQILEDRYFSKALSLLENLATEQLPEELLEALVLLATDDSKSNDNYENNCHYLANFLNCGQPFSRRWRNLPIFRTASNEPASFRDVQRAQKRDVLVLTRAPEHLAANVPDDALVLVGGAGVRDLLSHLLDEEPTFFEDNFLEANHLHNNQESAANLLREVVMELLIDIDLTIESILFVRDIELPPSMQNQPAILIPSDIDFVPRESWRIAPTHSEEELARPDQILIANIDVGEVRSLIRLAAEEPEWSALAFIEGLLAHSGNDLLLRAAVKRRGQRLLTTGENR